MYFQDAANSLSFETITSSVYETLPDCYVVSACLSPSSVTYLPVESSPVSPPRMDCIPSDNIVDQFLATDSTDLEIHRSCIVEPCGDVAIVSSRGLSSTLSEPGIVSFFQLCNLFVKIRNKRWYLRRILCVLYGV